MSQFKSILSSPFVGLALLVVAWAVEPIPSFGQDVTETSNDSSFVRLADPKVSDALKLTDEQRGKVAALITARAEAIGKAAPADRPQVISQSEKDLSAILTDEQRVLFAKEMTLPRLRFNFRFQALDGCAGVVREAIGSVAGPGRTTARNVQLFGFQRVHNRRSP